MLAIMRAATIFFSGPMLIYLGHHLTVSHSHYEAIGGIAYLISQPLEEIQHLQTSCNTKTIESFVYIFN